jgi:hypothetical protein
MSPHNLLGTVALVQGRIIPQATLKPTIPTTRQNLANATLFVGQILKRTNFIFIVFQGRELFYRRGLGRRLSTFAESMTTTISFAMQKLNRPSLRSKEPLTRVLQPFIREKVWVTLFAMGNKEVA